MKMLGTLIFALSLLSSGCVVSPTGCTDDFDCEADKVCRISSGECDSFICSADTDCTKPGLPICRDNRCLAACEADSDCNAEQRCDEGACAE